MKILHVIDSLFVGGAESLVTALCVATKRSDDDVEIYALRAGGPLQAVAETRGVIVHNASSGSVYSPLHIFRFARFAKTRKFDIIHVHLYPAQLWVVLGMLVSGCRTPLVTTEHSTSNQRRTMIFRWLDRWMYRRFTGIAAISTATRDALVAHAGKRIPPVQVVLNGIDPERFRPENRVPLVHEKAPLVLLSTGRLSYVKDQETIIRALAMVDSVKLLLAGDGPQRREQEGLAVRLGVRSRVDFLGIRTDIPQLIASADIYIQASRWEGFCLAVAEAMCGGLPCIAARNTGLQEVVGSAGLYFEPGDAEGLARAIRRLASDPSLRAELSLRGIAQARKFTLPECYSRYYHFYQHAIPRASQ